MEKNNKGLMILVAILSVIILGFVGYIAYDKISENDEKENIVDNKEEDNDQSNNSNNNSVEDNLNLFIDDELSDYVFEKNAGDGTFDLYINNKKVIFEDKGMNYAFNKVKKLNDDIFIVEKNLSSSSLYAVNANAKVIGVFTVGDSDYYKETPVLPTKAIYRDTYRIEGNSIYVQTDRFSNGGDDYTVCNTLTNDSDIVIYEEKFDYLGNDKFSAPVTTKTITRKQYMNEKNINCDKFNGNDSNNSLLEGVLNIGEVFPSSEKLLIESTKEISLDQMINVVERKVNDLNYHKVLLGKKISVYFDYLTDLDTSKAEKITYVIDLNDKKELTITNIKTNEKHKLLDNVVEIDYLNTGQLSGQFYLFMILDNGEVHYYNLTNVGFNNYEVEKTHISNALSFERIASAPIENAGACSGIYVKTRSDKYIEIYGHCA